MPGDPLSFSQRDATAFGAVVVALVGAMLDAGHDLLLASNADDDLVQMPDVVRSGRLASELAGKVRPELLAPTPDRLIGHGDAVLQQHLLDQAQTDRKTEGQPHGTSDDLDWLAMALVTCWGGHPG
jgi:hypothetical protein